MGQVTHTFLPIYNEESRILILGTFPSVKSREENFYYGHPQNRFWKIIANISDEPVPMTIEEKKRMLLSHHIAVWDVIHTCEIEGSSDSSIKNVTANELSIITNHANIKHMYANGDKAYRLYMKFCQKSLNREIIKLPSTSPANAAFSMERLLESWAVIKEDIGEVK